MSRRVENVLGILLVGISVIGVVSMIVWLMNLSPLVKPKIAPPQHHDWEVQCVDYKGNPYIDWTVYEAGASQGFIYMYNEAHEFVGVVSGNCRAMRKN